TFCPELLAGTGARDHQEVHVRPAVRPAGGDGTVDQERRDPVVALRPLPRAVDRSRDPLWCHRDPHSPTVVRDEPSDLPDQSGTPASDGLPPPSPLVRVSP